MDRRQFLHGGLGATLLAPLVADRMTAQAPVPAAPAAAARTAVPRKLVLDIDTRSLQWLRTANQIAEAVIEIVAGGVCPNVGPAPGHIDSAQVGKQLPAFVATIKKHGLRVSQVIGPQTMDLTPAAAEGIIGAASQAGCTHYSLGGFTYDLKRPLQPQLDAAKLRIDALVRLNQKHKMTLVFDTRPGATSVGGVVLDLLGILKGFDPRYVGLRWDTGHMAMHGDDMWETLMRLSGPYVSAVAWRDRGWRQDLGLLGEGGPYTGPVPRVEPLVTQADGSAIPGTPAAPGAAGAAGRAGGAGRGGARAGGAGAGEGEDGAPAAGRRGGGAGGPARGPANSAGAGSIDANNPRYRSFDGEMPKRPIGGKNAKGGGWSAPDVAMGTGVLHIPRVASVLADLGFNGPSVLQAEYGSIGNSATGAEKIDRPRQWVIGMLKRDVITIRKSFEMAGGTVTI